jgi:hypothetical protein
MMLNHDVAITTVGSVLGHTDIRTTSVYAGVLDDTGAGALRTLGEAVDEALNVAPSRRAHQALVFPVACPGTAMGIGA